MTYSSMGCAQRQNSAYEGTGSGRPDRFAGNSVELGIDKVHKTRYKGIVVCLSPRGLQEEDQDQKCQSRSHTLRFDCAKNADSQSSVVMGI